MRRVLFAFIGLCLIAAPLPVVAQDADRAEQLALAERAIRAAQAEELAAMSVQMGQALRGHELEGMSPQDRLAFQEVMDEVTATMTVRMIEGMAVIYADIFTAEELVAFSEFYESPVGQSILAKNAAAAPQFLELVRSLMPDMMRQMVEGMCDRLDCTPQERRQFLREALGQFGMTDS